MAVWSSLHWSQLAVIGALFIWSGFVRSGLGFGGAALALPMMLLIVDEPILFLPALGLQLLFFSSLTIATRLKRIDWHYLRRLCTCLLIPVAAGLAGLLNLPGSVLSLFVYLTTLFYGVMYVLDRLVQSRSTISDVFLLGLGGYASGATLTGAPLIVTVAARAVEPARLRDTLLVLWILLVMVKLTTFVVAGVDLKWRLALATLPLAGIGHIFGMRKHARMLASGQRAVHRLIGVGLCIVSLIGVWMVAPTAIAYVIPDWIS